MKPGKSGHVPQQALHAARRQIRLLEKLLATHAPEVAARLPQIRAAALACEAGHPHALRLVVESSRGNIRHQLPHRLAAAGHIVIR
jgi:hypothetical protein